jgi:putative PIN family toxin of toxin-antitoxin system
MRVVIDTNVWVSGLLWKGDAWALLRLAEQRVIQVCIAYPMLLELEEVLSYARFAPRLAVLQQTPAQLTGFALGLSVAVNVTRSWPPIVASDPDDDLFLLCAVAGQAEYVITADRHLLALGSYLGIPIIRIEHFFSTIGFRPQ